MTERGVSFEAVLFAIQSGALLDDIVHPNIDKYSNQKVFVVNIADYAYLVPYVETTEEIFLKTIIPSRKATKKYCRGEHE
ncbi:MAG: toxin [Methylococcales bacterium]